MGLPNVLTTDNGSEFRNKLNAAMLKKLGIRHSFITPYHPQVQSNSAEYAFKSSNGTKEMWDEFIDSASYNTSTHESTTYSPFEVMFGRKARLPVEADLRPIPSNYDSRLAHAPNTSNQMAQVAKERQEILKDVKRNILAAQAKQKQHYDAKHTRAKLFDVGVQSVANPSDCVKRVNGAHLKAFHSQEYMSNSQDLSQSSSPLHLAIPSAFAIHSSQSTPQHSISHPHTLQSVYTTAFQSVYTTAFQSVYTTAFQSVYTTAFQSVYTTAFQSVYTTAFQSVYTTAFQSVYTTAFQTGACVLHYKAAEDDEEFDETSLRLKEGEYALNKDITVCLWLEYRSLNGSTPLRDVSGGDFVIVNEELHGEFDEFRSKVYAYVDKNTALLKLWDCFKFGVEQ
eukprot:Em1348g1a